jgi:hypothetical protein
MPSATVLISEAKKVKEGQSARGAWTLFSVIDGNEDRYSTFDHSLFKVASELQGKRAEIEFEADERGKTLKAIKEAASDNGDTPKLGTGEYIRGQSAPSDARRSIGQTAANAAADLTGQAMGKLPAQEWTPALICAFYDSLETHIFNQLLRRADLMEDRDIPFLPEYEG